jgi:hypothetical protein
MSYCLDSEQLTDSNPPNVLINAWMKGIQCFGDTSCQVVDQAKIALNVVQKWPCKNNVKD